jgi:ribosomal-protein-alanine N-acetyltransferase
MPALEPGQTFDDLFDQMLARIDRELSAQTGLLLAAFLPDGPLIGFFTIFNIVRGVFHSASAGWRVSADQQRQGYALESLTTLLTHAFSPDGLSLHRVQANIIPTNTASLSLARRVGFRQEGYALRYLKIAGQWQDHLMFAKLADEHAAPSINR